MLPTNSDNRGGIGHAGMGLAQFAFEHDLKMIFRAQPDRDFGIDAHVELQDNGRATGQLIALQIKTGPSYFDKKTDDAYIFYPEKHHIDYWLGHALPVVVCLCNIDTRDIHWQLVSNETLEPTPTNARLPVPFAQKLTSDARRALRDIATKPVPASSYDVRRTVDTSHSGANRRSFDIIVNGRLSKAEIAAVIRQATADGIASRYHRNAQLKAQWGQTVPHVIWTYVYLSVSDIPHHNHVCHSQWLGSDLNEDDLGLSHNFSSSENIGKGIRVIWNEEYSDLSKFFQEHTISKEHYLDLVAPLINELIALLGEYETLTRNITLLALPGTRGPEETKSIHRRAEELCLKFEGVPCAPVECCDVDEKLRDAVHSLDNIGKSWPEAGASPGTMGMRLLHRHMAESRRAFEHLLYELEKVR
jgi:hypothetical protein